MTETISAALAKPDRIAGRIAVWFILVYRRFVSPHKGFRCAHQRLHRNGSCSDYGLVAMRSMGFSAGLRVLRERFAECKSTAQRLTAAMHEPAIAEEENDDVAEKKKDRSGWQSALFEGGCLGVSACAALPGAAKPPQTGPAADGDCLGFDFAMPDCSFDIPDCGCS